MIRSDRARKRQILEAAAEAAKGTHPLDDPRRGWKERDAKDRAKGDRRREREKQRKGAGDASGGSSFAHLATPEARARLKAWQATLPEHVTGAAEEPQAEIDQFIADASNAARRAGFADDLTDRS